MVGGGRSAYDVGYLLSPYILGSGKFEISMSFFGLKGFPLYGRHHVPVSFPMSPRRAGSVPWVPRRSQYANSFQHDLRPTTICP